MAQYRAVIEAQTRELLNTLGLRAVVRFDGVIDYKPLTPETSMAIITDHDQEIKARDARIEELTHELTQLRTAVAEHCEAFGHQSFEACGLHDVRNQVERLLAGQDVDCGIEYPGITGEVEALVYLAQYAGTDGAKTKKYLARLSYPHAQRDAASRERASAGDGK